MKRIFALILAFAMLFSFAACDSQGQNPVKPGNKDAEKPNSYAIRENNLRTYEVYYDDDSSYLEISGLKDEAVQDKINAEIYKSFLELRNDEEIPPYSGLDNADEKWTKDNLSYSYAYAGTNSSVGNILSLYVSRSAYYNTDDWEESLYYREMVPLNFDLNTGEKLKLTDLFKDPEEGMKYINEAIQQKIDYVPEKPTVDDFVEYENLPEIEVADGYEFKGIDENQEFYISYSGNSVCLVFDYDDPWVKLYEYAPKEVFIDIKDVSALQTKFVQDEVFVDGRVNYMLMSNGYDPHAEINESEYIDDYKGHTNFGYGWNCYYYGDMPQYITDVILTYPQEAEEFINDFCERAEEELAELYPDGGTDSYMASLAVSASPDRVGRYTSVSKSVYADLHDTIVWESILSEEKREYVVFEDGKETPVELKDIFVEGFDYKYMLYKYGIDTDSTSFAIGNDGLYFWDEFNGFQHLPYRIIGCENMTIFE